MTEYEELMQVDGFSTIYDMNFENYNKGFVEEYNTVKDSNYMLKCACSYIDKAKALSGKALRYNKRDMMKAVLKVLYNYISTNVYLDGKIGQCNPSMRTITKEIFPQYDGKKSTLLMRIQRAIHALERIGLIKIHTYRAATNTDRRNNPNFFYELTPVSKVCKAFRRFFNRVFFIHTVTSSLIRNAEENTSDVDNYAQDAILTT